MKMQIDLLGADGNAFVLMGIARKLARKLELDGSAILKEMKSSDYEHLIATFEKHFGEHVNLMRGNDENDWGTDELGEI